MKRDAATQWALPILACMSLLLVGLTSCDDDDDDDDNGGGEEFVFASDPASAYARVDRKGMPAVATAVITSKDAYNAANPVDDAALDFVPEITTNVTAIHAALDDDLIGLGLTPCAAANCVNQAAPLVVPDVLEITAAGLAGFPNGRRLPDQVIDVTLAVVLLDLTTHSVTTFATLPLNPASNDKPFLTVFPYLAAPNPF
jgi:Domain of unknown function (DUF4331)